MINMNLVDMIARDSRQMAGAWVEGMKQSKFASGYMKFSDEELLNRCRDVYENLGKWLEYDFKEMHGGKIYASLGKQRCTEGIPLCQVQFALHLTKKILWNHVLSEGILNTALEMYQAIDLFTRIQNFFDLALFYITRGYMEEVCIKLETSSNVEHHVLKSVFPEGSFLFEFKSSLLQSQSRISG